MPTGYTAKVATGEIADLKTFAMQCARGMGACITMRDDPWDAPIPERFEPSTYHDERLTEAVKVREELLTLSLDEMERRAGAAYREDHARWVKRCEDRAEQRQCYERMLHRVETWDTRAEGIREFMLDQLRESIRFDCDGSYDKEPVSMSGMEWHEAALTKAEHSIHYHTEERDKEIARTEGRNAWLAALRESLA